MFSGKLSALSAADIHGVIDSGISEGLDVEFKRSLPAKNGDDPWMANGRIGDEAKKQLAQEIIAFANTDGGTLILGMDEDPVTKQAIGPLYPLPRCKDAANSLQQSIGQRIEPRLPVFECEGVVTEADGTSGVVVMRALSSYLAPHRHTQDLHCYTRRKDASEPMSMSEIHEATRRAGNIGRDIDSAFSASAANFFDWIPLQFQRTHPAQSVQSIYREDGGGGQTWVGSWALRVTTKPFSALPADGLVTGDKSSLLEFPALKGSGRQGALQNLRLRTTRVWQPRLRSAERQFDGTNFIGSDRLFSNGQLDRYVFSTYPEERPPNHIFFSVNELMWNVASVMQFADEIRAKCARPSQSFALEVELLHSSPLYLEPYAGAAPYGGQIIPPHRVSFPRYEVGPWESFNEVLTAFDRDVWNSAGYHPDWALSINWADH